jgi:hypothetical protein
MLHFRRFAYSLTALAVLYLASPNIEVPEALAGKEVPVVAALCDALKVQLGVRPAYRRVKKAKDGTITIRGLTTEVEQSELSGRRLGGTLSVERVTLTGISQSPEGLFDVSEAKLINLIFISDEDAEVSSALRLPEITMTHLRLKAAGEHPFDGATILPLGVHAQSMLAKEGVLSAGGTSFEIGSIEASWQGDSDTGVGRTDIKIEDIHYPVSAIRRSDPTGVVLSLIGGGDLVFDLWGTAQTTTSGGIFEAALSARSLGRFKITGDLAGRSLGVVASAPAASQNDAGIPAASVGPMMINRFAIRFEDQSLTGKLLGMLAKDQGVDRERLIAEAASAIELGLEDVENRTLIEQLKIAVQTYLAEPKSITVTSQLTQPMPVGTVVESAAAGPAEFFSQVPASITVND